MALSKFSKTQLEPQDFVDFGLDIQQLQINSGQLKTIKNNAFKNIHSVKRIDLSENSIENIEKNAFIDVSTLYKNLHLFNKFLSDKTFIEISQIIACIFYIVPNISS